MTSASVSHLQWILEHHGQHHPVTPGTPQYQLATNHCNLVQKALMLQVSYQVQLSNGSLILVDVLVVFSQPIGMQQWQRQPDETVAAEPSYQWAPVTRG